MTHLGALLFNRWLPEAACGPRPQSRGFPLLAGVWAPPRPPGKVPRPWVPWSCPVLGCVRLGTSLLKPRWKRIQFLSVVRRVRRQALFGSRCRRERMSVLSRRLQSAP